mmetsp:Transcript_32581/g.77298  ORF Transcript_32581/g.77298 Transcript_32581/m.77298 type:complete len:271 (+) Transcript_32581:993-1805(+)
MVTGELSDGRLHAPRDPQQQRRAVAVPRRVVLAPPTLRGARPGPGRPGAVQRAGKAGRGRLEGHREVAGERLADLEGEFEDELGPDPFVGLAPHPPVHELRQLAADGQPQARPAVVPRRRDRSLHVRLEKVRECRRGDARPRVDHREPDVHFLAQLALLSRLDHQRHGALIRELARVPREVGNNLHDARRVPDDHGVHLLAVVQHLREALDVDDQLQVLVLEREAQLRGHRVDHERRPEGDRLDLEFPLLDLGEVEHVVHDLAQLHAALL